MKFSERMKAMIKNWLDIQPAPLTGVSLYESLPFEMRAAEGLLWYRGNAAELNQFYMQTANDKTVRARFWATPTSGNVRKLHSGLPAILIDTLAYLVKNDLDQVDFLNDAGKDVWEELNARPEFQFPDIVGAGIVGALSSGDGAWKISIDKAVSPYPIVEFYTADRVEYISAHGIVSGIDFYTDFYKKRKTYRLKESYRKGSVTYTLFDGDREVDLSVLEETADLKPVEFDGDYMMAVPFRVFDNPRVPVRGKPLLESKVDALDMFDEILSQWVDAFRKGRAQKYIPEALIPRDVFNGSLKPQNPFDNEYISVENVINENGVGNDKIQIVQPEIPYDALLAGYTTALDLCLQGIVSPATLGIDIGKMSSADAQREKKDVTAATRNSITGKLEVCLPQLIAAVLMTHDLMCERPAGHYTPTVAFGEYGAPDFDSRVETVTKAAAGITMSIETQVDELWGSSKDDDWKAEEVRRIKHQRGIETVSEPRVGEQL